MVWYKSTHSTLSVAAAVADNNLQQKVIFAARR